MTEKYGVDIDLDDLIEEAHARTPEVRIGGVVLRNALRMPPEDRTAFREALNALSERTDGQDPYDGLAEVIILAAEDKAAAKALVDKIGGDLSVMNRLTDRYFEGTQVGEASPSQN